MSHESWFWDVNKWGLIKPKKNTDHPMFSGSLKINPQMAKSQTAFLVEHDFTDSELPKHQNESLTQKCSLGGLLAAFVWNLHPFFWAMTPCFEGHGESSLGNYLLDLQNLRSPEGTDLRLSFRLAY